MRKIYFTIKPSNGGLADQVTQIQAAYAFGRFLGFSFFYRPSLFNPHQFEERFAESDFRQRLKNRLRWNNDFDVDDILGLGTYFEKRAKTEDHPKIENCDEMHIFLATRALTNNDIQNLTGLKNFIHDKIAARKNASSARHLLLNFHTESMWYRKIIGFDWMQYQTLDLWQIYQNRPRTVFSRFRLPRRGLKTVVHIRLGDTAAIATPWQTWLYWRRRAVAAMLGVAFVRLLHKSADEQDFDQLTVADFYAFIQNLNARFRKNAFAFHIFSDGFEQAFHRLHHNPHQRKLVLNEKQFDDLMVTKKSYNRTFNVFRKLSNCKITLGETPKKFSKWVNTTFGSEIIITAFATQKTVLSLLQSFKSPEPPVVIILHKPLVAQALKKYLAERPIFKKAIAVNIVEPDFADISRRLVEYFPNLGEDKKSRHKNHG